MNARKMLEQPWSGFAVFLVKAAEGVYLYFWQCFFCILQLLLQVYQVQVLVAKPLSFWQADSIDNWSVIQLIWDNSVFSSKNCLEEASIGIKSWWIKNSIIMFMEGSNSFFKLLVNILCAANKANTAHSEPVSIYGFLGSCPDPWMIWKSEIVVCTEV